MSKTIPEPNFPLFLPENRPKFLQILVFFAGFSIAVSTALMNILFVILIFGIFFHKAARKQLLLLPQHPLFLPLMMILAIMFVGVSYSIVDWKQALISLNKYREFLILLLFLALFSLKRPSNLPDYGYWGFMLAMLLSLLLSYIMHFTGWHYLDNPDANRAVFKNYLTQNFFMAIFAYFIALIFWFKPRLRIYMGILLALVGYNIFFMSKGRIGYLVFFSLMILIFFQKFRWKGIIVAIFLSFVSSVVLYQTSPVVQKRINEIGSDLQRFQKGNLEENSIGYRIQFYQNSLQLVSLSPFWGRGSGSFEQAYKELAKREGIHATHNPHNEYLLFAVQWGGVGLVFFLFFLFSLWRNSFQLKKPWNYRAQGVWVAMAIGCLLNSFWLDNTEGHFFAFFLALLYSSNHFQHHSSLTG